jgi:hypothetical protein
MLDNLVQNFPLYKDEFFKALSQGLEKQTK